MFLQSRRHIGQHLATVQGLCNEQAEDAEVLRTELHTVLVRLTLSRADVQGTWLRRLQSASRSYLEPTWHLPLHFGNNGVEAKETQNNLRKKAIQPRAREFNAVGS